MKILSGIILTLAVSSFAHARGGMIGGGDVDFKPLMICDAAGIDPTHDSSRFVWVTKEVDYNGQFLPNTTLRVVTLDRRMNPVRYYVTHSEGFNSNQNFLSLNIWQYDIGSNGNRRIGSFVWSKQKNIGYLKPILSSDVEELQLTNCAPANR